MLLSDWTIQRFQTNCAGACIPKAREDSLKPNEKTVQTVSPRLWVLILLTCTCQAISLEHFCKGLPTGEWNAWTNSISLQPSFFILTPLGQQNGKFNTSDLSEFRMSFTLGLTEYTKNIKKYPHPALLTAAWGSLSGLHQPASHLGHMRKLHMNEYDTS